jgi:hypothetical protein
LSAKTQRNGCVALKDRLELLPTAADSTARFLEDNIMSAKQLSRIAISAAVALGLASAAPAWADGHRDHDGFGPVAALAGLAAAVIAAPYVFGAPRVVVPAPVYAPPPVAYAPAPVYVQPPVYAYAPPVYRYVPAPRYRGDRDWHDRGWHRGWQRDDDR